jgi:hypothetical protein
MTFPVKQSQTDLPVLEQACRNTPEVVLVGLDAHYACEPDNASFCPTCDEGAYQIRLEYNRLMRLKKSKKRWRA